VNKKVIQTPKAPAAIGPYSQGMCVIAPFTSMIFTAGQVGFIPETKLLIDGGIQAQTRQALLNLKAVLETAGSSLDKVVKTTVFLANMDDFGAMNEVYATFFTQNPPARSTVQVSRLPANALVEIEAVAIG
jgi:2-iminobutanoate/2-iminopropanoate deaminase